ncbi:gliding motility-associated C-terminal domain-containing protein [Flavobacterium covae]
MKAPNLKTLIIFTYLFLSSFFPNLTSAQVPDAGKATTGSGLYKDRIFWLNWDLNKDGAGGDLITNGSSRTFTSPAGVLYQATISNVTGTPKSSNSYDYSGNNFPSGYGNIGGNTGAGNIVGINNGCNACTSTFRITITANYPNGISGNVAAFVIGGTETLASTSEFYQITVPSGTVRYLDKYIKNDNWTNSSIRLDVSNSGRTIKVTNPGTGDSRGDALLIAEDVPYIDAQVKGGGGQHFGIGFIEDLDYSDAPNSYGKATHIVNNSIQGGTFTSPSLNTLSTTTNVLDTQKGSFVSPNLILGTNIDVESNYNPVTNGTIPNTDDITGIDDEDGIQDINWSTCTGTVFVKNTTASLAYLNLWIDANSNGIFDNNENTNAIIPSGTNGNINVPLNPISGLTSGNSYYARLRLSTTQNLSPSGFAADGEAEDHWVNITKTTLTTNPLTSCVGSPIIFSSISGMLSYNWTGPNGFTSNQQNPIIANSNTSHNGIYTLVVTTPGGCTISDSTNVIVNPLPAAPIISSITQPSCNVSTGSVSFNNLPASGTWTVTASPGGTSITGSGSNAIFSGLTGNNTYTFTVTNSNGCTSAVSAQVLINAQPATPNAPLAGAVTQPTCATATGSFQIMGYNSNSVYNFSPAVLNISATGVVTANAGTYTFTETNAAGCTSAVSAQVLINAQPATPNAPLAGAVTQPTCATATGSFQIMGYNSNSVYNFNPAVLNISATGVVTANAGTYTFTETNAAGCTSAVSAQVLINAQPATPNAPLAGAVTQPTCATATGSFQIMGYNSNSVYNFSPAVLNISATGVVTANAGTYTFTETNAAGCTSAVSAQVLINAQPATPNAPLAGAVTQPTCATATGSFQIMGYNSNSVYNFNPAVLNISATGVVTANAGTYTFTETNAAGCTSAVSAQVLINAQPATPNAPLAGAVTQPTCATATGSFQIMGYNSNSVYNFSPAVLNISATGVVMANAGTYTFTETNAAGCTSTASAQVLINAQPATPNAPLAGAVTQPTCATATGSFQIMGYNSNSVYNFSPAVLNISATGVVMANAGTYTFTETNAAGCTSAVSAQVLINAQPATPNAPLAGAVTQPTCATATGSFQIMGYNSNSVYNFSPAVLNISATGVVMANAGTYTFTETNAAGCTSAVSAQVLINAQPATPNAPLAGAVTQPTCATATGSFQIMGYNSNSVYNFNPAVLNISATGVVTANAGTYTFTETNAAGCTSAVSAQVLINAQPATPNAPLAGAVTQPTCATATGSFQIMGYNSNSVYNFNPAVLNISATGVVTANAGTYTFTETNAAGCTSAVSAQVLINAQPATPNAPLAGAVTQPTCATATGSFQIMGYNSNSVYNFNPAVLNISATGVVTANAGTYTFTETNAAGCTSAVSAQVLINAQPATPNAPLAGAVTQPTCATATGSFQIMGYNSNSVYNFSPAVLNISATGVVMANAGTYTFTETNAAGCTSAVSAQVLINAQPATPNAPLAGAVTQPTCATATGSFQIMGYNSNSVYNFNPAVLNISATGVVTANAGTYTFTETNAAGCTSAVSAQVLINAQPATPNAPLAGAVTQPTCATATGSFQIMGYNSNSVYNFSPAVLNISATGVVMANAGTYTFTETNAAGCTSAVSAQVLINAQPATPNAPLAGAVTQPTCATATGSFQIMGYNSNSVYNFNPAVLNISATGVVTANAGTYTFTETNAAGCTSAVSAQVLINAQPATPNAPLAGAVTQPTCATATGSFQIMGYNSNSVYNFNPAVLNISATGVVTANAGTYTFTETNAAGCTSAVSAQVLINAQPATPNAPLAGAVTQPTCATATGSFQIMGYNSNSVYNFNPAVLNISATGVVTANAGTYTFTETNAAGCTSAVSAQVLINAQPATPNAPLAGAVTQPTCATATGSFQIMGYNSNSVYNFSPAVLNISATGVVMANAGTYTFTETNAAGCTSAVSAQVLINAQPATPNAPLAGAVTQPTCATATGSFQIMGYNSNSVYNFNPAVLNISATGVVTANAGTYTFTETNAAGCTSAVSAQVLINAQPATPNAPLAGAVTQPTCATATGSFQIMGYNSNSVYNFNPAVLNISATGVVTANAGTYTFTETNAAGCTSAVSAQVLINAQPATPNAPLAGAVTQPTCATATGSFQIMGYNSNSVYNFNPAVLNISATGVVTANAGTYTFTETNAAGCTSAVSAQVLINAQPATPNAPLAGAVTQPTCATATGSFQIMGYNSNSVYNFNPAVLNISATGVVTANAGTYTFTETNAAGCTSAVSAQVLINAQPATPNAPLAGAVTQPTCATATGSFQIMGYNSNSVYNFNPAVLNISATGVVTANAGTYTFTETNAAGCTSAVSAQVLINAQPATPNAPLAGAVTQPTCATATGSFQIMGYNSNSVYNFSPAVLNISATGVVMANAGTYTFTETNAAGCTSAVSAQVLINAQPATPNAPLAGAVTQPTCATATGSFQIMGYNSNSVYNFNPAVLNISATGVVTANAGTYTFTETNAAGCTSTASAQVLINAQPATPNAPLAGAVTQPTCATATGSFQIMGYNSNSVYNFNPAVLNISATGVVTANAGTYTFTETNAAGCTSTASAQVLINAQPATPTPPTATTLQPTCTLSTGTITFTTQTDVEYSINNGTSYQASNVFSGLNPATYTLRVRSTTDNTCTAQAATTITINTQPVTPSAPITGAITQPNCITSTGSVTLNGLPTSDPWTIITSPSGLTLNGTGTSVNFTGLNPGNTYTFTVTNSNGCISPASSAITVYNQICAVDETTTPINGLSGGTTAPLTANDTLNGALVTVGTAPGNVQITASTVPMGSGLILNPNGTVSIPANTPAGTYTVNYTICEVNNPKNCSNVSSNVVVDTPQIIAITETTMPINGLSGGTTAPLTANDTLNGALVTVGTAPGNVQITASTVPIGSGLILNPNGTVSIPANTPAGTYTVNYTICEVNNPKNCSNVSSNVVVDTPQIIAITETTTPINGLSGGTTAPLTANDTLNGALVTVGTAPGNVQITASTVPMGSGLILNPNGTVSIPANTPAGTYTVNYTICEVNNPKNCSNVSSNVVVDTPQIIAITETTTPINGLSGGTTAPLTANDTLNGALVTVGTAPGNVQITASTVPMGSGLILNPNGTVSIPANTPAGTYTVNYTICEVNNPKNCSNVSSNVVVDTPQIIAITETTTPINGLSGGTTAPLTANDTLNGALVTVGTAPGNVQITASTVPMGSGLILNPNGTVSIPANTPAGTYTVNYTICEVNNPKNCSNVSSNVVVDTPQIIAITETTTPINGLSGGTTAPLTANDTLNGALVTVGTAPGNVQITASTVPMGSGLILNPNGTVSIPANTPAGTYTVNYTICEVNNPKNCSNVSSNVVVDTPQIIAITETTTPINGLSGGTTAPLTANDTLNGALVTVGTAPGNVQITASTVPIGSGLILNPNGTVSIPANTPAGTYTVNYTICEVNNPKNCSNVSSNVVVDTPQIIAITETTTPINGLSGGTTAPLTANDTLNGALVTVGTAPGNVQITASTVPMGSGLILNPNGTVSIPANTPAGTYTVNYTICEVNNPKNCSNVSSNITVGEPTVNAQNDIFSSQNGSQGETLGNIFTDNGNGFDLADGNQANLNNITLTTTAWTGQKNPYIDLNGNVIVPSGTPSGTYTIPYKICLLTPFNTICDTATVTVRVEPSNKEEFVIYNHMTPNGDGNNDVFFIDGIDKFPNNSVEVYNRWGVLVYEAKGYNNNDRSFRGISSGRVTIKQLEELPEGTYYYMFKYEDTKGMPQEKAGYLYINR